MQMRPRMCSVCTLHIFHERNAIHHTPRPGVAFQKTQDKLRPYADAIERARALKKASRSAEKSRNGEGSPIRWKKGNLAVGSFASKILIFYFSVEFLLAAPVSL